MPAPFRLKYLLYSTTQNRTTTLLSCPNHLRPNPRLRRASAQRLRMRLSDGRAGRRTARISDLDWMTPMSYSKFSQDLRRISLQSHHLSGKSSTSTSTGSRVKVGIASHDLVDPTKCTVNRIDKPQVEREATCQPLGNYDTSTTAGPRILQYGGCKRGNRAAFVPLFVSMPSRL